jgi:CheY-like chemotaxis protein
MIHSSGSIQVATQVAKVRVCVVDEDPAVRDSLATLMGLNDHEVATFDSGGALLRAVAEAPPDCVICAAELPDMSGLELFRALRRDHPEIRFALLLGRTDHNALRAAQRSGVDAVFAKPLVHRRLKAFIRPI